MCGLSKISGDGFADGANVGEVSVSGLVGVVDGAERLERHQRLGVEQARRGAGGHVVVAVEVARVHVAERCLGVREPGLVEHGYVLQRGVVRRVARALGLPSLPVALTLRTRRTPFGLTLPVDTHFSMMRSGHLEAEMMDWYGISITIDNTIHAIIIISSLPGGVVSPGPLSLSPSPGL